MPTKSTLNETPRPVASEDPSTSQNPDLTSAIRQLDADQGASSADRSTSVTEGVAAERTERRRQRAAAHEAPSRAGYARGVRRSERPTESTSAPVPPRRMTLRDSVSITLIAVLAAGGVLGAILGALNVTGWVIGMLVAGLTVVVSAILRRYSRLT
jgi:Flp pilus assembly protein TadB